MPTAAALDPGGSAMTTAADLARQLKAKRSGSGWIARCPAHEDHRESLSISEGEDGRLLAHCHAGCSFEQIIRAAGVEPEKPNGRDRGTTKPKGRIVATYDYHDARGEIVFQVVRYAPKDFRQRRPDGNGGWIWGRGNTPPLPYRLPQLLNANEVFIVEGEKDADNLAKLGLAATCNPGGADKDGEGGSKWPVGFGRYFDGRHAILVPDNDDARRRHVQAVAKKLHGKAASIRILELPDLPPKGDVSDWLAAAGTRDLLEELAAEASYFDEGDGETKAYPFTLLRDLRPVLDRREIVRDLIPKRAFGEAHADSGGGKTAIIVDLCLHVAAGREYRERRVEQQPVVYVALEGHGGIDNRVIAAARELGIEDAPFALVKVSDSFRDPDPAQRVAAVAQQLLATYGGDCPLIVIDTYTAALGADGSDCDPKDVSAFIAAIQRYLLTTCTVLILHHFGKDMSRGGRGWSGLRAALDFELEIDQADDGLRTMRVTKSRDGSDQQPACCYRLRGRDLGTNSYGDPVTAVVVEHLEDEDAARRGKRLSPKARAALNIMWEMIKDPSQSFPLPGIVGLRCVLASDWEAACIAPGAITKAGEEKERRRKFKTAQTELVDAQAIVLEGGATDARAYPAPTERGGGGGEP
jgi:hypothetical protein